MTLTVLNPHQTQVGVDYDAIHNESVEILSEMEERGVKVSVGVTALIMSIGRLLSPSRLSEEEEIAFLQAALEWTGAYFSEGMN